MRKIYITGTGRCGTTFLIKLFTFLKYNTLFTKENYTNYIYENCNSGMETRYNCKADIIKNPKIIEDIGKIVLDKNVTIKAVIIPVRDYTQSAKSRVKHKNSYGGLWNAKDEQSQINFYNKIMANYIYYMTKYEINTIFLDFDKMISDKKYLFDKLNSILKEKNITFEQFEKVYDIVTENSKPK